MPEEAFPGPKFRSFDARLTILLRADQLEFLDTLTRRVMRGRGRDARQERITKNTLLRAMLDAFRGLEWDVAGIPDEAELARRLRAALGPGGSVPE